MSLFNCSADLELLNVEPFDEAWDTGEPAEVNSLEEECKGSWTYVEMKDRIIGKPNEAGFAAIGIS